MSAHHTVQFEDGTKKTLGVILPTEEALTFETHVPERMEIISGECRVKIADSEESELFRAGRDDQRLQRILQLAEPFGISVQKASRDSLEKLAGQPFHQDHITDPHNLGACIRTAAAMGVEAVIVPRDRAATLTPTARKVAAGGAEKVKFIQVTNLARTLGQIKENYNVRVVGTMLDEKALPIQKFDFTGTPVCVVMGAEDTGLRPITQSQCDQT
ncbi:unnamed protein product, partial [Oppiella nova]